MRVLVGLLLVMTAFWCVMAAQAPSGGCGAFGMVFAGYAGISFATFIWVITDWWCERQ